MFFFSYKRIVLNIKKKNQVTDNVNNGPIKNTLRRDDSLPVGTLRIGKNFGRKLKFSRISKEVSSNSIIYLKKRFRPVTPFFSRGRDG